MGGRFANRPARGLAVALVALALAVRVLVPSGWMPSAESRGLLLTLCSSASGAEIFVEIEGKSGKGHGQGEQRDNPCAFAGLGMAFAATDPVPAPAAPFHAQDRAPAAPALIAAIGRGLAAPPPPATGPPATA
ncbi:hypothetical protein ACFQ1E_05430 [Sphingomonas canadensis]|uniref:DUF2946 domain-containing protein n=1 Tax=Sphingomonas canadensis TaxID=1219257 RepID=A0ABW3H318_9SPHN|nr:hypothetical protein [Sphingomonas canadensis]MCW3835770.1 hypothetical protein [Sphingomonas canadensis]